MRRAGLSDSNLSVRLLQLTASIVSKQKEHDDFVMISSPSDSPMISASGKVWLVEKFAMGHPERGRFLTLGWVRTGVFCDFSTYKPPYLQNGARYDQAYYWTLIGIKINDLEWHWTDLVPPLRVFFTLHVSFGAHHKNMNDDRPILTAAKNVAQW